MFKKIGSFVGNVARSVVENCHKVGRSAQRGYASVKALALTAVASALALVAPLAAAVPPDFTALTAGIDLSTLQTAVLAALVALLGLYLIMGGGKTIIGFFKGGR
jgi:hypothetical protein